MDKVTKAHYRYVRKHLESKDKDTQASIRRILKERAKNIQHSKTSATRYGAAHFSAVVFGLQLALSEFGIDIKRYEG